MDWLTATHAGAAPSTRATGNAKRAQRRTGRREGVTRIAGGAIGLDELSPVLWHRPLGGIPSFGDRVELDVAVGTGI